MPADAVSCRGLKKYYADVKAVDGLDLSVGNGECFGLLGPNGAGKTTTIEILEGLTVPDAGDVAVLGMRWRGGGGGAGGRAPPERPRIHVQDTPHAHKLAGEEGVRVVR